MKKSGFTLVEILVVVSIIGILSTIGLITYTGAQAKARDTIRKADLGKLALALEGYFQKNGQYIHAGEDRCSTNFYGSIAPFMAGQNVPKDPLNNSPYCYTSYAYSLGRTYRLFAKLENCTGSGGNLCGYTNYNYSIFSENLTLAAAPGDTLIASAPTPTLAPAPTTTTSKHVFVTSTTYNGNLKGFANSLPGPAVDTGIDGADKICQSQANAAFLYGTWKAWLSTDKVSAADRLIRAASYKRIDGVEIALSWTDLTSGTLLAPIRLNALGQDVGSNNPGVWTNTNKTGLFVSANHDCNDWTSDSSTVYGYFGLDNQTTSWWTYYIDVNSGGLRCDARNRLYCFEQ